MMFCYVTGHRDSTLKLIAIRHYKGLNIHYGISSRVHSIYTHFRNKMEKNCEVRSEIDMPKEFPSLPEGIDEGVIPSVTDFNLSGWC